MNYMRNMSTLAPLVGLFSAQSPALLRRAKELIGLIRAQAAVLTKLTDREITAQAEQARTDACRGNLTREPAALVSAAALVVEAVRRTLGITLYDVQLLAGLIMTGGAIAEVQTGEGKTLSAVFPVAWHGWQGSGVHVVTPNSYLAARDQRQLQPVYDMLDLTSSLLPEGQKLREKRRAYDCDVTYGTGYEFGFDFLRDRIASGGSSLPLGSALLRELRATANDVQPLQRGHAFALVDEADSVLLDEAGLPLVLGGGLQTNQGANDAGWAQALAARLQTGLDYALSGKDAGVLLTERGLAQVYDDPGAYSPSLCRPAHVYVEQALRAKWTMRRDVQYVVRDKQIGFVDQATGRIFAERKWQDGLHQALELKEGLPVTPENVNQGRISRQRYFGLYDKLCGMTGTARGEEREFRKYYNLEVAAVPLRRPTRRVRWPDQFLSDADAKWEAVARAAGARQQAGQPVLVGTRTIEQSLALSSRLTRLGLPHCTLNGIQEQGEAEVITQAGGTGRITVATNMAGRGTDIKLSAEAIAAGGLHVIVTEWHISPRTDRQLIGRAARQGDPGSCQFFAAADDELVTRFAPEWSARMRSLVSADGGSSSKLSQALAAAQVRAISLERARREQQWQHDQWCRQLLDNTR